MIMIMAISELNQSIAIPKTHFFLGGDADFKWVIKKQKPQKVLTFLLSCLRDLDGKPNSGWGFLTYSPYCVERLQAKA